MANYGFFVANTGSTLYSGFTFIDSQGSNIIINIPPSQTFYISADESVTGSTYVGLIHFLSKFLIRYQVFQVRHIMSTLQLLLIVLTLVMDVITLQTMVTQHHIHM
jgi:hypothetical protein